MRKGQSFTVGAICEAMERRAPRGWACAWDKVGLSIGAPGTPVSRVLVALTVTPEAFRTAKRTRAELIVAHHPVIMKPLPALRTDDPATRLCLDIAAAGMACYSAHTNLDVAPGGVNHVLAERLALRDPAPLLPAPHALQVKLVTFVPESHLATVREAVCGAGAGIIGDYSFCTFSAEGTGTFVPNAESNPFSGRRLALNEEPERRFETVAPKAMLPSVLSALVAAHPYEEPAYDVIPLENTDTRIGLGVRGTLEKSMKLRDFARFARTALNVSHVRLVGRASQRVKTVAVIGGSGGGEIGDIPGGVDVLVTGDVKYHNALDAVARGLGVVDAGHAGTEKWIVPALADYLKREFPSVRVSTYTEPEVFKVESGED